MFGALVLLFTLLLAAAYAARSLPAAPASCITAAAARWPTGTTTTNIPLKSAGRDKLQNYEPRTLTDFSTRDSRIGFIRKVYSIFSAQILTTIVITASIMGNAQLQNFLFWHFRWGPSCAHQLHSSFFIVIRHTSSHISYPHRELSAVTSFGTMGILFAMMASPGLRHKAPMNYILLSIYTLLQSLMVGVASSLYDPKIVCLGAMHTLSAFLVISIYR